MKNGRKGKQVRWKNKKGKVDMRKGYNKGVQRLSVRGNVLIKVK